MSRNIYVQDSKIHGKGVFTKKNFAKGEVVFIMKGKIYHHINKNSDDTFGNPNWVGIDKNTWIDPKDKFQFINHSSNPNMGIKGKVTYIALRNIKKGEELTFDYSITEEDTNWVMNSLDKDSLFYRQKVKSIQFLPMDTFKRYMPYIPKYFQKVYIKHNKLNAK